VEKTRLASKGIGAKFKRSVLFTSLEFCEMTEELVFGTGQCETPVGIAGRLRPRRLAEEALNSRPTER
jgi:hypothetical protein